MPGLERPSLHAVIGGTLSQEISHREECKLRGTALKQGQEELGIRGKGVTLVRLHSAASIVCVCGGGGRGGLLFRLESV